MSDAFAYKLKETALKVRLLFDPGVMALNQAIELEERPPARSVSQLVFAVCALVAAGLTWAAFAHVDIVTNAHGQVTPAGELVAVQYLEGGIVSDILVSEGGHVEKGQTLLRLVPLDSQGGVDQFAAKRVSHLLAIEGERAIIEDRAPAFGSIGKGFEQQTAEQQALYLKRIEAHASEKKVISAQIAQRRASVERLQTQLPILEHDAQLAEGELAVSGQLLERQLTTRDRYYSLQRDVADHRKQLLSTRDELTRAQSELTEYERRLADADAKVRAEAQEAISKQMAELAEVDASLANERGRANRLNITAPVSGVVTGLTIRAVNAVVRPGDTLMQLVPTGDPLVVMADVQPQDIARLSVGQQADIRVSAFEYSQFGTLQGKVERISAATFSDRDGHQFYKIRVLLDRDYLGLDPKANRIMPGMDAEVDVKTGARTVLNYLLKPVARTWETALREP